MMEKVFAEIKWRFDVSPEINVKELKRIIDIEFLHNFKEYYFKNRARTNGLVNSWANRFIRTNCVIKLKEKK